MINSEKLAGMRREYSGEPLTISSVPANPFELFGKWFQEAIESEVAEANAVILATANSSAIPSVRTVLLKAFDERGFTFFTNYNSHKGDDIRSNPKGEILFLWLELARQVRISGSIQKTSAKESDLYFSSRPYLARLSAIASPQSKHIADKHELSEKIAGLEKIYPAGGSIPRPDHWGGFRLIPDKFEFWQGRENRLHDRIQFTKSNETWDMALLAP